MFCISFNSSFKGDFLKLHCERGLFWMLTVFIISVLTASLMLGLTCYLDVRGVCHFYL